MLTRQSAAVTAPMRVCMGVCVSVRACALVYIYAYHAYAYFILNVSQEAANMPTQLTVEGRQHLPIYKTHTHTHSRSDVAYTYVGIYIYIYTI